MQEKNLLKLSVKADLVLSSDLLNIRDLALSISPCDRLLLINRDNKATFSEDFDRAVESKACFAVRPYDDIIALDFDEPETEILKFNYIHKYINDSGYRCIVINSGTPGHRHLFCRVKEQDKYREIVKKISSIGASGWLRSGSFIRPPLSPHRAGLAVSMKDPSTPIEAIRLIQRTKPLNGENLIVKDKIRYGISKYAEYSSGSEIFQSIVNHLVAEGVRLRDIYEILSDKSNLGGASLQSRIRIRGEKQAKKWLIRSYKKAVKFNIVRSPELMLGWESAIRSYILSLPLNGRKKMSLICVIKAHLAVSRKSRSYVYTASDRQIATEANISSLSTVRASHRKLDEIGILRRLRKGEGRKASAWELFFRTSHLRPQVSSEKGVVTNPLGSPHRKKIRNRGRVYSGSNEIHSGHDAFRYSFEGKIGLGASSGVVLSYLLNSDTLSNAEICRLTGFSRSTVGRCLKKLEAVRIAYRANGGWGVVSGNVDDLLDQAAVEIGLDGSSLRQRDNFSEERIAYLSKYSLRYRWTNA